MSAGRGRANHSLYLAKILLAAWRRDAAQESLPVRVLCQAYLPAIRLHLLDAYGWFLLDVTGASELPGQPPHSCDGLLEPPPGKALPGEIREFRQLERDGWLAQLITAEPGMLAVPARSTGNLAAVAEAHDMDVAQSWVEKMSACFERMGDSLDEF